MQSKTAGKIMTSILSSLQEVLHHSSQLVLPKGELQ
jgi:hypothetical protein